MGLLRNPTSKSYADGVPFDKIYIYVAINYMNETIEYLKDRYNEELARFTQLETKCSSLLTFISIVIGVVSAIAGFKSDKLFQITSTLEFLRLFVFIVAFISIFSSWAYCLIAIKIGDYPTLPRNRQTAEYLKQVGARLRNKHIYNCYVDTIEKLISEIDNKAKYLEHAYTSLSISAALIFFLALLTIYMEIQT